MLILADYAIPGVQRMHGTFALMAIRLRVQLVQWTCPLPQIFSIFFAHLYFAVVQWRASSLKYVLPGMIA
jgi:hypothetical protein